MFAPLSWIFKKLARRYDRDTLRALPKVWTEEFRVPWWERVLRWFFGAPFTDAGAPDAIFRRWTQRAILLALYCVFLWWLYESFWAWGIFD